MRKLNVRFWKTVPSQEHLYNWVLCSAGSECSIPNIPMVLSCSIASLWDILEVIISLWLMLHDPALLILQLLSCWLWLWFLLVVCNLPAVWFFLWLAPDPLTRFFTLSITSWESVVIASLTPLNQELRGSVGDAWGRRDVFGTAGVRM